MRLTFVIESNTDRRLIEGLAERFELTVVGRSARVTEFRPRPKGRVRYVVGNTSRAGFGLFVLRRLLSAPGDEPVLVQGYGLAALAANLAGRLRPRSVTMLVCNPMERYYACRKIEADARRPFRRRELWLLEAVARANARLGRSYVVLSRHLAEVVRGHGTRRPVEVIPVYGVDRRVFHPSQGTREALRLELGLPVDAAIVFFSSRLAPEKDSRAVLEAVAELAPELPIRLLYRGRERDRLRRDARRLGIEDRLLVDDMVDPGDELARLYQACDACVQASREEGLGFAPLEALACKTPVVASATGGLRETIVDGVTGWTYPVGDSAALADRLRRVLNDPDEARRLAAAGAEMVAQHYACDRAFTELSRHLEAEPA